jgi:S-adenosylmethionine:tRNA ribosyltransferase-isomerase
LNTADFDYSLPQELIAQFPAPERDQSRLLVLDRHSGQFAHRQFCELPEFLRPGDVLVLNNSKVIPARLRGTKAEGGGQIEILLLEENQTNDWWVMLRPAKRVRKGSQLRFVSSIREGPTLDATVVEKNIEGHCRLTFHSLVDVRGLLDALGEVPLPPYVERPLAANQADDRQRYQTVYAQRPGSVAAPTAGLHFTPSLLQAINQKGVVTCFVTLHVGLGTFAPVKVERIEDHPMHEEWFELGADASQKINLAKETGQRVVAVGTTSVRVLESVARQNHGKITPDSGRTRIFIYPPFQFQVVDTLLTNFHLPRSTLLMLVSAFAAPGATEGRARVLESYAEAVRLRYRFFSYGDAMLVI